MNLKDRKAALMAEAKKNVALAETALAEAPEKAAGYQKEAETLLAQAEMVQKQIDLEGQVEEKSAPVRLPYEEAEAGASSKSDFSNPVYVMRYGNIDDSVKAVAVDLYGPDYLEKRSAQKSAYAKYLRHGDRKMRPDDYRTLNDIILTPDVIKGEVAVGYSVHEIKAQKDVQVESSLEMGGVLVPEDSRMEIIRKMEGPATVRGRARVTNTVRDSIEFPKLESESDQYTSLVRVTWVDETPSDATVAQTNMKLGSIKVPVHTVMARMDLSRNLLEDAGVAVIPLVGELFAEAQRQDENEKFISGTGVGQPEGVLGLRTNNVPTPIGGVGIVPLLDASTVTADGIIDLEYALPIQYRTQAAAWAAANSTFKVIRKLKDGNGDYLWSRGLAAGAPPLLEGYDMLIDNAVPEVAANAFALVYGNWLGYLIVERVGMTVERVDDSTTVGQNKTAIFMRRRLGGQVIMPWMFKVGKIAAS